MITFFLGMAVIIGLCITGLVAWFGLVMGWWQRPWETWEEYQAKTKTGSEHHKYKHLRKIK